MPKHKLKWKKPQLIVLVRSKPEERVLSGCKIEFVGGGPEFTHRECEEGMQGNANDCDNCSVSSST